MAMKQCPVCGEKYSDTYKKCPFCEEEEALQSGGQIRRGGRRVARNRQPNLLSPILIVLILILAGLLVYLLFGDQIADRLSGGDDGTQDQQVEDVTPEGSDSDVTLPEDENDATMPEDGETVGQDPSSETESPTVTDPSTLPETLTISYGTSPTTDFTMSVGDAPIPLTASGGSGTYTWSSSDDGVASVDANGAVTAISAGQATLTVTDGTSRGTCLVRVRGGSTEGTTSSGGSSSSGRTLTAGTAQVVNAGNGVRVRSAPNTSSEILATLSNGASVQVVQSAGSGWYQISFVAVGGVTTTGYMMGEYLSNT